MDKPVSLIPTVLDAQRLKDRTATHDRTKVNQDQFLKLMLTQLKNQDPSKPNDFCRSLMLDAELICAICVTNWLLSIGLLGS